SVYISTDPSSLQPSTLSYTTLFRSEMLLARAAKVVGDLRGAFEECSHLRILHVEDAQHVRGSLLLDLGREQVVMLTQPVHQLLFVARPARTVAARVQVQLVLRDTQVSEQRVIELDHFSVDRRPLRTDALDRQLVVLAVAAPLRPVVAVEGRERVELHGLRLL